MSDYTNLTTAQMRGLYQARASAGEILAYAMLTRYHNDPEHPSRCWRSAQLAAEELGMRPDAFTRALNALTRKEFEGPDGPTPVLTKVAEGHNGRCAVYEDNLHAAGVARQFIHATRKSSKADSPCYSPEGGKVARQSRMSSKADSPSQIKELIVGAALPPAERSGAVSQPDKREPAERSRVVTGTARDARTAARLGGRAAALPSVAEWMGVQRLLETQGLDALTPADREVYHAGHAAYAALT